MRQKRQVKLAIVLCCILAGCGTRVSTRVTDATQPSYTGRVCILNGPAPSGSQYKAVSYLDTYMHHYGSAENLLDVMGDEARKVGADAVIGVKSGQEFGYFPWRIVRPRAQGHAIRFTEPIDCASAGGSLR